MVSLKYVVLLALNALLVICLFSAQSCTFYSSSQFLHVRSLFSPVRLLQCSHRLMSQRYDKLARFTKMSSIKPQTFWLLCLCLALVEEILRKKSFYVHLLLD